MVEVEVAANDGSGGGESAVGCQVTQATQAVLSALGTLGLLTQPAREPKDIQLDTIYLLLLLNNFMSTRVFDIVGLNLTLKIRLDAEPGPAQAQVLWRDNRYPSTPSLAVQISVTSLHKMPLENTILKSFNGLVGKRYPDVQGGLFITSPNMTTIPPFVLNSLSSPQCVRLRKQLHYGEHDFLLNPQPIISTLPHHALIRYPGAGNDTYIFWALPQEDDFEPIEGQRLSGAPLGHISSMFIEQLYAEYMKLFSSSASPKFATDLFLQLSVPSLFTQALMRWRIAQRMILLIEARITWLVEVMPTFGDPDAWKAGIPVWFYRGLELASTVKVVTWVDDNTDASHLHYSWTDFEDSTPVSPTVYNGSVEASQDRYRKMAVECWTIAFPAAIFGADLIQNDVDYSSNLHSAASSCTSKTLSAPSTSTAGPSHTAGPSRTAGPSQLYAASSCPRSPANPSSSQPSKWVEAAVAVSHKFTLEEQPRRGVNRGYVLPEPAVFANHKSEVSRQRYFLTYLKVCEVFIAAIDLLGPIVCQRPPKDWRRLLSLELHGSLDAQTREGATKLELCQEMNNVAARMGSLFSVDLTNLAQASSRWDGIVYTGCLPDDIQRAILQEIFDISFKQEFLLLDRFLCILMPQQEDGELENEYDASTHEDRNLIIEDALFSNGPPAFGHSDSRLRQAALHSFFQVMRGWSRSESPMSTQTIQDGQRLGSSHVRAKKELKDTKFYLASYYIYAFAEYYCGSSTRFRRETDTNQGAKRWCIKASTVTITPTNSGQKTRIRAAAQVVGANAPGAKAPAKKKEIDLKALVLQQKKEAQKKSQQKAQQARDAAIRERARAMREAQGDDNDDDNTASQDLEGLDGGNDLDGQRPPLDEEEQDDQDLDGPLDEDPDALLFQETFKGSGSDDEHHQAERHGNDEDEDNDALALSLATTTMTIWKWICRPTSVSLDPLTPPSRQQGGKITKKHFTPRTCRLAILGKRMNCRATATQQPFPSDKHGYNMEILQDLAKDYKGEDDMVEVFARVPASLNTQQELVQFVVLGYARSGFFTNCMAKAREWVTTRFGLPGKMNSTEVKELVGWLLKDGHYKYGKVDIHNKTYNTKLPFGCEGIAHILCLEVFATKGGANIEIFREIVNVRKIAPTTIALMITFIEHSLNEYVEGVYRHVEFSDTARPRYCFHLSSFNRIANKAPKWANNFATSLYKLILTQLNKEFLLDAEADDLTKVDIEGLEAATVAAPVDNRGPSPLPSSSPPRSSPLHS
ncbi:hypothetical protein BDP27DRAFT_1520119 [Rhodocollybia butyracea]|uniref:DUF6532 domain-containing protein n=1 Tax=Rhodocollybia butyracea TaxID=206335 RepID=A0A9P5PU63_9AGAR|nr:hypothetical protein BDP27DRAFT_1520119 [Rhodocollybia butyracea]